MRSTAALRAVARRLAQAAGKQSLVPGAIVGARTYASQAINAAFQPSSALRLAGGLLAGTALSLGLAQEAFASSNAERTFIAIKPDGVQRGLVSEIIARFERKGYKLVAIKIVVPSKELTAKHYAEHDGKPFFPKLVNFLSSGPVVAMVWEGKDVIKYGRSMIGATNPLASAPGTIRGDFGIDVGRNIIHGSDGADSAQREIALWFKPEELAEWKPSISNWVYE